MDNDKELAQLIILFNLLIEQFNPRTIERLLLIAAALEWIARSLREEALELAIKKEHG